MSLREKIVVFIEESASREQNLESRRVDCSQSGYYTLNVPIKALRWGNWTIYPTGVGVERFPTKGVGSGPLFTPSATTVMACCLTKNELFLMSLIWQINYQHFEK